MSRRNVIVFLVVCQLVAALIGGLLVYAKDHPDSELQKVFTKAGFHLK